MSTSHLENRPKPTPEAADHFEDEWNHDIDQVDVAMAANLDLPTTTPPKSRANAYEVQSLFVRKWHLWMRYQSALVTTWWS